MTSWLSCQAGYSCLCSENVSQIYIDCSSSQDLSNLVDFVICEACPHGCHCSLCVTVALSIIYTFIVCEASQATKSTSVLFFPHPGCSCLYTLCCLYGRNVLLFLVCVFVFYNVGTLIFSVHKHHIYFY